MEFFRGKKVLITGGLGFLGSNLAHRLVSLDAKVSILDCLLKDHGGNLNNLIGIENKVVHVIGDIRDPSMMERLIRDQDVLFNVAAQTSHTGSMQDPFLDVDINVKGQINLLEICRKINPGIRIVYCSTRAVYGSNPKSEIDENCLPNPLDVYAANKLAGEYYHRIYSQVHGLKTVILRVANGYGPRAQMKGPSFGILNWFIRLAVDDHEIKVFGDGRQVRDYVYVDDIIDAFLAVGAGESLQGEIFNAGTGQGLPLIDIVHAIIQIVGKGKIVHVSWPEQNKKIDVGNFVADVKKIKTKLDWSPKITLDQGLKKTTDFYKKYKNDYW